MRKRAVGYCRISTLMQVENTSLKDQEEKIRMYAKLHDIVIDKIFTDKAVSGKSTDRPQYYEMMKYVKENYGYDCFADDTGMEVEALNGEAGVD